MDEGRLRRWLEEELAAARARASDSTPLNLYHLGRQHAYETILRWLDTRAEGE